MSRPASVVLSCLVAIGCSRAPAAPAASLSVTSTAFAEGSNIPTRYTCEGEDKSPPLAWSDPPVRTKSLALIVEDPDAPDPASPNRKTFVHWVVFRLAPETRGMSEGAAAPAGAREGENDFGKAGYRGPCPPSGRHRYIFKVFALDSVPDPAKARAADLYRAIEGHVLAEGRLVGMYEKGHPRM
jgi:Raf kinase inhibitor-like YbhB/YbcL family protein